MDIACCHGTVALLAERVDIGHIQQTRILAAVWRMAGHASLGLHHRMLKDKRSTGIRMALCANRIFVCGGLQVVGLEGTVHIMAVIALEQPLIDLVVEGHGELRLEFRVALIAKFWFRSLQQVVFLLRGMNAVAAYTTDIRLCVLRTLKVRMLSAMAAQASLVHFGR